MTLVSYLHVILPSELFERDTILFIIKTFNNLKEMVTMLDDTGCPSGYIYGGGRWLSKGERMWPSRWEAVHLLSPIAKIIAGQGVSSCIIVGPHNMYNSPCPTSYDMLKRTISTKTNRIFIHQAHLQDLPRFFNIAASRRVAWIHMTKFTGNVRELEDSLKLLTSIFIENDPDAKDILESEVVSANQLITMMADENRRGCLGGLSIHKVILYNCVKQLNRCT